MDMKKQLAFSIIKFLKLELESGGLDDDGREALEVAIQCLETTYSAEGMLFNNTPDLLTIYESAAHKGGLNALYPPANKVNKEMAESRKVEGNNLMRDGKFVEAIASYTEAIHHDSNNAIYYSNRAAAYAKLNDNKNSISDCEKAIKIDPSYSKAYGRMGLAYFNEESYEKSIEAYEKALLLDPSNQPYREQLDQAKAKMKLKSGQSGAAAAPPNPLGNMDLSSLLSNPAVMNMAQTFMQSPQVHSMFANMVGGTNNPSAPNAQTAPQPQGAGAAEVPNTGATGVGMGDCSGFDINNVLNATTQFAQQMQQQNPDVVESLRQQFQLGRNQNEDINKKDDPK